MVFPNPSFFTSQMLCPCVMDSQIPTLRQNRQPGSLRSDRPATCWGSGQLKPDCDLRQTARLVHKTHKILNDTSRKTCQCSLYLCSLTDEVPRISMWVCPGSRAGSEWTTAKNTLPVLSAGGRSQPSLLSFKGKSRWAAAMLLQPPLFSLLDMYGHQWFLQQLSTGSGSAGWLLLLHEMSLDSALHEISSSIFSKVSIATGAKLIYPYPRDPHLSWQEREMFTSTSTKTPSQPVNIQIMRGVQVALWFAKNYTRTYLSNNWGIVSFLLLYFHTTKPFQITLFSFWNFTRAKGIKQNR